MKATHNAQDEEAEHEKVVRNIFKEQIESNSQLNHNPFPFREVVRNIFKEQIESNSQLGIDDFLQLLRCAQYLQRTN